MRVLDLKAQLAAAGIVTADQVKAFDEKEAKAKEAREAKAQQRQAGRANPSGRGQGKGPSQGKGKGPNQNQNHHKGRGKARPQGGKARTSVDDLKAMGRGEAYDRVRKIVAHSRLDDKERTIPLPDDQTFNFVTATGSIGRLYLGEATVASLKNGKSAITSFMSNHGLSHCVLPKDIALELAEVFPLWLRHLRGHEPIIEVPKDPDEVEAAAENTEPAAENTEAAATTEPVAEPVAEPAEG